MHCWGAEGWGLFWRERDPLSRAFSRVVSHTALSRRNIYMLLRNCVIFTQESAVTSTSLWIRVVLLDSPYSSLFLPPSPFPWLVERKYRILPTVVDKGEAF